MKKIQIYTHAITARLEYSCNLIFKTILNTGYELTQEIPESIDTDTCLINYSPESINGSLQIIPAGLIEERGISPREIDVSEFRGVKILFPSATGDFPFDIFSAVFFMVTRYEEYLPFEPDVHGRFQAEQSVAFRNGFHQMPVVELWTRMLAEKTGLTYPAGTYDFQLTIDVDEPWQIRNHSLWQITRKLAGKLLSGEFKGFTDTLLVYLHKRPDPWFTFDYLDEIEKQLKNPIQYFVLLGTRRPFDTAPHISGKAFKELIVRLGKRQKSGIHPSYASFESVKTLESEYYSMSYVLENKIQRSRQHFLRMKFPDTFRNLIKLGIRQEYSMGWVSQTGFRAGIARPFHFYDLREEKETHLMLVPFFAMDRTMKDYMHLNVDDALKDLQRLIQTVRDAEGQFCMLWHNDSISDSGEWTGWKQVFEKALVYAKPD